MKAVKVQEAANIAPKYFCQCGQLVGGYKVELFSGVRKLPYCPNCGEKMEYKEEEK